ncbi:hypothetical protein ACNFU2_06635 [Chryseobacterium sp. PTM-20240506]|uniref:hypothetical protein n=1 Tax=Chryseobacterium sp. PTM-20240506 TaxID=3400631 RepID=UPI003AAD80F3
MSRIKNKTSEFIEPTKINYPIFRAGNTPNRRQRRIDSGVNKRTLHKPKEGQKMLLVIDKIKWKHFIQKIPVKNKAGEIISFNIIKHTN